MAVNLSSADVEIYIPRWHPATLNSLLKNRWAASRLKRADREMLWAYSVGKSKAIGMRRVELTIILRRGQRAADPDAQWKSLLDALKHAGLLLEDNRQNVELAPVSYERGTVTEWGTRIRLIDHRVP